MTEFTTVRHLAVLTVFGREYYSSEGESDTDEFNIQESDKPTWGQCSSTTQEGAVL